MTQINGSVCIHGNSTAMYCCLSFLSKADDLSSKHKGWFTLSTHLPWIPLSTQLSRPQWLGLESAPRNLHLVLWVFFFECIFIRISFCACLQILSQTHNLCKSEVFGSFLQISFFPYALFSSLGFCQHPDICLDLDMGHLPSTVFLTDHRENVVMHKCRSHKSIILFCYCTENT